MLINRQNSIVYLLLIMSVIWLYRLFILLNSGYDLFFDEAYYYGWSQNLDFGYFSKPPMLSLLIYFTTWLFGDSVVAIKIGALLLYPITSIVIYLIAKELFDYRVAFYSALIFFTLPSVWLSSMLISTDVVLLLFWALSMLFFIKAIKYDQFWNWFWAGVFAGFGLLSKYNFIFFIISVVLIFILIPSNRKYFKNRYFYMAIFLAFIIFLPNLYWNYNHEFISFVHTKDISHIDRDLFNFKYFIEFFASQFLLFGPILFFYFLVITFKYRDIKKDQSYLILFLFSIVMLSFIMGLSFLSRAFANWSAPSFISATILVVAYLLREKKEKLLIFSIFLHSSIAIIFFNYHLLAYLFGVEVSAKMDPFRRVSGWSEISQKIKIVHEKYPNTIILTDKRKETALFTYYLKERCYIYNPKKLIDNQYHMDQNMNDEIGKDFLLITNRDYSGELSSYFEDIKRVDSIKEKINYDYNRSYDIFYLKNFNGY